jgi:hypothetical protein
MKVMNIDKNWLWGYRWGCDGKDSIEKNLIQGRYFSSCWGILDEGTLLAVGGCRMDSNDNWWGWLWIHESMRENHPVYLGLAIARKMKSLCEERQIERLYASVGVLEVKAIHLLEMLGFRCHGKYEHVQYPGEETPGDYFIYCLNLDGQITKIKREVA